MKRTCSILAALMLTQSNFVLADDAAPEVPATDATPEQQVTDGEAASGEAEPVVPPLEPTALDENNFYDLVVDKENKVVKSE